MLAVIHAAFPKTVITCHVANESRIALRILFFPFLVTLVHANLCMHYLSSADMQPLDVVVDFKMAAKYLRVST